MPSVLLSVCLLSSAGYAAESAYFQSAEHVAAAQGVKIRLHPGEQPRENPLLHLPNGIEINYGELSALGGDFYGIPSQPIISGQTDAMREAIFIAGFDTLATDSAAVTELPKILQVMQLEEKTITDGLTQGMKPDEIYQKIGNQYDKQWNCITGGSCSAQWWLKPGRYLKLAEDNDEDHFRDKAVQAYLAGHHAALRLALVGHVAHDTLKLELAYAMNAFASHFLTDRFSSGHMRTPNNELPARVTPSLVGSLLVKYMHDEEDRFGLHVHNARGDVWQAFGDKYYFSGANEVNRRILTEALQMSADAVYTAFEKGIMPEVDQELALIPEPDETGSTGSNDISPLFYEDETTHQLLRRTSTRDIHDRHWTASWWGWSTLSQLASERGIPSHEQARLIRAGYKNETLSYGVLPGE